MNRIYISGKISGTDLETTRRKFQNAECYAWFCISNETSKFNIVNPTRLGLTFKDSWFKCMRISIWHLLKCRSIYMLKDWRDSRGAKIEFWIAVVLNYKIIFQEND